MHKEYFFVSAAVSNDVKNYLQFRTMFGSPQIIKSQTRITCSSTSLIDHILASLPERMSQEDVINVGFSDHQLIYCTRKVSKIKFESLHKKLNSVHLRIMRLMLIKTV